MDWQRLLNSERLGNPGTLGQPAVRTDFQRDFDRLVFSSAFRRMHGKTQVFPRPESDLTHTRLTHSLEVSCVARSIGTIAYGDEIAAVGGSGAVAEVAAAAALAHDLGNPPFGHSGEDAIAEFFRGREAERFVSGLTPAQIKDLQTFEGNALGFRLLTRTKPKQSNWSGGLQLTLATLGAFTKYPRSSVVVPRAGRASEKKFGFFQSEAAIFEEIATRLALPQKENGGWARHPVAFITEAADDICYRIVDLEDGYKLGLVSYDLATDLLAAVADLRPSPTNAVTLEGIHDRDERIGYLRAKAINNLVHQSASVFVANQRALLAGEYDQPLLDATDASAALAAIANTTKTNIYQHRPVLEIETAGFGVLAGLLLDLLGAAFEAPRSKRSAKILSLVNAKYETDIADQYETVMSISEYVASMTDDYAISCYRVLRGIELPRS